MELWIGLIRKKKPNKPADLQVYSKQVVSDVKNSSLSAFLPVDADNSSDERRGDL
ncbi:hypothetical protein [Paenibacillus sp. GM2]|uniref:hypothetical protein n=1 Tax=Paenibacillus sp. GM2 TaxID=1622070 RepID=UPI000A43AB1D|nr:hypothetical protein [Paenibacillus sp. GM2]